MQFLRQLQHIVRVARLRTVDVVDEVHAGILAGKVLTTAVTTESKRTFACHDVPEEISSAVVHLITSEFRDTLKPHHFRHLRVGVHIVEVIQPLRHGVQQSTM